MDYIFDIALVFGGVFVLGMIFTVYLWLKFFPLVKKTDPDLYQKLRFRLWPLVKTPYASFVFRKGYRDYPHENVRAYALVLYWVGHIAQWGFNIYMVLMIYILLSS